MNLNPSFLKKINSKEDQEGPVLEKRQDVEDSKEHFTSDTTPHKSLAETEESQDVYDSFCMPEVDNYQLEFRNKVLQKTNSDSDEMRKRYLNKLTQRRVWLVPREKPRSHQS